LKRQTIALAASAAAAFALALPSSAGAVDIVNIGNANNNETLSAFVWTAGGAPGTGTLTVSDQLVLLNFSNAIFADGVGQDAYLTFSAVADGDPLQEEGDGTFRQTGLDGTFEFRTAAGGGGDLLLSGIFTGAWLSGKDDAGAFMTVLNGGTLELSSGVADLSAFFDDSASFSFSGVVPGFGDVGDDNALDNFTATGFSATFSAAVPEPTTWALMIMGFGGAGAMLRSRRRALVTAA
jgi:hypothetical protein